MRHLHREREPCRLPVHEPRLRAAGQDSQTAPRHGNESSGNDVTDPEDTASSRPRASRPVSIVRAGLAGCGIILVLIGILTPFPMVPIGLTVALSGIALVARNSDSGRAWLARMIDRHPRFQRMLPDWLRSLIFGEPGRDAVSDD